MTDDSQLARRRAVLVCAANAVAALVCTCLMSAAVLVPAPTAVLPVVGAVCIAAAVVAARELLVSIAVLRARPRERARAIDELRRQLERLPEARHPLGY